MKAKWMPLHHHKALGDKLKDIDCWAVLNNRMFLEVYGKSSKARKLMNKLIAATGELKSHLDDRVFEEHSSVDLLFNSPDEIENLATIYYGETF